MNHVDVPVTLQLLFADLHRGPRVQVALVGPGTPAVHAEVERVQAASVAWARGFGLVGLHVEFELGERVVGIELTAAERGCAARVELARLASALVGWANDIYTHEKEIRAGETHNLVFVLAQAEGLSLAAAVERAVAMHDGALGRFMALVGELRVGGSAGLGGYAAMLTTWVRGHLDWGRETGRYGGEAV